MTDNKPKLGDCRVLDGAFATDPDDPDRVPYYFSDITLRDLFAGLSMLAHRAGEWDNTTDDIAHRAYADADAMLKERAE